MEIAIRDEVRVHFSDLVRRFFRRTLDRDVLAAVSHGVCCPSCGGQSLFCKLERNVTPMVLRDTDAYASMIRVSPWHGRLWCESCSWEIFSITPSTKRRERTRR